MEEERQIQVTYKLLSALELEDQELETQLKELPNIEHFSKASTKDELLRKVEKDLPDIIIMKTNIRGEGSLIQLIRSIPNEIRIIAYEVEKINELIYGKMEEHGVEFIPKLSVESIVEQIAKRRKDQKKETEVEDGKEKKEKKPVKNKPQKADTKNEIGRMNTAIHAVKEMLTPFKQMDMKKKKKEGPKKSEPTLSPRSQYRVISLLSAASTGKSIIASNLAVYTSLQGLKTALIDADIDNCEQSYLFDIQEEKIRANAHYEDYNKKNMIKNALEEANIKNLERIGQKENKNLTLYTGDPKDPAELELDLFPFMIDGLRSLYDMTIIDTGSIKGEVKDLTKGILSISDTVLFVIDLQFSNSVKNQQLMEELKKTANISKFHLVINQTIDNYAFGSKDIVQYYKKELGIEFKKVYEVPIANKACIESGWFKMPAINSKNITDEFKHSIAAVYKGIS